MSGKEVAVADDDHQNEHDDEKRSIQDLLNAPAFMGSLMRRQLLSEMVKSLPKPVQDRVTALKNIQLQQLELEVKYYEEVDQLDRKYQALYQPLYDKRRTIITGEYEPTEAEKEWNLEEDDEEEMSAKMQDISLAIRKNLKPNYDPDVKGVPDFWFSIFRTNELLAAMVQECDEPALKKLSDIKIVYAEDSMSYILEFYFAPNDFFTNTVLTKQYFMKSAIDPENPFGFEGPEIVKCTGCVINWNKGTNLTIKTIKKKQKHKARGAVRTVSKQVPADTFFNFFNPPLVEDGTTVDIDTQNILGTDFEIGHFLRARIIPKAALYFTGDIVDDDDDDDFDEEEEEEEEEEEDDSDDDGPPPAKGEKGGANKNKKGNPAECQQQ